MGANSAVPVGLVRGADQASQAFMELHAVRLALVSGGSAVHKNRCPVRCGIFGALKALTYGLRALRLYTWPPALSASWLAQAAALQRLQHSAFSLS